jgi:hypothetical protein
MNYTRLIPPTDERGGVSCAPPQTDSRQPPTGREGGVGSPTSLPQPRIFDNDFGTFHVIADDHYWAARAAMRNRSHPILGRRC